MAVADVTMSTGSGEEKVLKMHVLEESRGYRYCELVFDYGEKGNDIYSTSHNAECDLEWWGALDLTSLAQEFGARAVFKNGPQWWSSDVVGLMMSDPVDVAGTKMRFGANLPPGTMSIPKYTVFSPAKYQKLEWKAGLPVYKIVDDQGNEFVLQGNKVVTEKLSSLGASMEGLPEGWRYEVEVLKEDLVMDLDPSKPIPSVQDEYNQIYIQMN
ncbi:MAG TPA: hypothetical protein DCF62_07445 [Porticoccaceae bacterium]|nr:hypothetical protein [Porticoccaceae bacterium]HCO58967.1 hypothetical protein [Porticoccaceae bacterium]